MATDRRPDLTEIATTRDGRDITRGYVDALPWLPPTDRVLPLAGGWRGYEELLRDDQVEATFAQRRLAVVRKPWAVEPGGSRRADRAAAELVRATLARLDWDAITDQMLYARFFGFAAAEVMWGVSRDGIAVEDIRVRDRARFAFAPDGALLLRTSSRPDGERVPQRKFWVAAVGASHHDEPYGRGLAHALYWPVWFKRQGARFWATFLEKFGAPTAVGRFPAGTDAGERARLLEAVQAIQTDAGVILPEGMAIELLEASRGGTASYGEWMGYWGRAIAKIVLGQTMTTEDGSSRAQAQVHWDVREDIVAADADLVCESANHTWVRWLIDYELPGAAYPRIYREMDDPEDLRARAERDEILARIGWRLKPEALARIYGEDYEAPATAAQVRSEDRLRAPGTAQAAAPRDVRASEAAAAPRDAPGDATPIDPMTDRMQTETEPAWAEIMDGIKAIVERAESLVSLRNALLAAYGDLPADRLAEVMAMGFAAAEMAGRFDARQESA
jgi:phage gp29-like protein